MANIICADSDQEILELYNRVLSEKEHDVAIFATGAEILDACKDSDIDLVIINLQLSDLTGETITKTLRARERDGYTPIMVVADNEYHDRILKCMDNGADEYLIKPFKEFDLLTKISISLNKRTAAQEKKKKEDELFAGTYELIKELDKGSYSTVYRAIDRIKVDAIEVALKIIDMSVYDGINTSFNAHFLREAYELSKLEHPNIVKFFDFGKSGLLYYLAMEYIDGPSLESVVTNQGIIDEKELLLIAYQVVLAFEYLNTHNVIHRDVKPANILLNTEGDVKLSDFGLAKQQDDMTLTKKHDSFMGTPHFTSPEQIMVEDDIDIRGDIYSLGATLYYCGTKIYPFPGATIMEILDSNMTVDPRPVHEINPEFNLELSLVIQNMMSKDKEDRMTPEQLKGRLLTLIDTTVR